MAEEIDKHQRWASRTIEWIAALPSGSVIGWTSINMTAEEPIASGWVDVEVPEILDLLELGWTWTVVAPTDPDVSLEDPLALVVPPDTEDGWTPEAVSRALDEWTHAHAGRTDVRFEWDAALTSMMRHQLKEAMKRPPTQKR